MLDEILTKYIKANKETTLKVSENSKKMVVEEKYSLEKVAKSLGLKLDIFRNIFKTFISTIDKDLEKLKTSIDNEDFESIIQNAHKIKGASANLKINDVFEISKKIELSAKENSQIDYKSEFNKLSSCVEDLKKVD
jgi:HPt (histidine-containing phosphotransfer) domain-containing protein